MKELSIEQKAKRYDLALERAKELLEVGLKDTRDKRVVLSFFPELVESEDEGICRKLIAFLKQCKAVYGDGFKQFGLDIDDALAWLEKQGEQKLLNKCMYSNDNYTDEERKVLCEDCKEKCAYAIAGVISTNAQAKKEPVNDDLEGEINRYLSTWRTSKDNGIVFCEKMARHFAAWQKEQLMAKAIDGEVGYWNLRGLSINTDLPRSVSEGDVVKIITIKED